MVKRQLNTVLERAFSVKTAADWPAVRGVVGASPPKSSQRSEVWHLPLEEPEQGSRSLSG